MNKIDIVYQIAEFCSEYGIKNAVICPGSRSAPLTISFVRNKKIKSRLVFDERSAAYIALGMAQLSGEPTVLICTSGTAALNFAPAVAEAYWQQVPLLVLTGDRPPEWIGQGDGQTIRQGHIYQHNVKAFFELAVDKTHSDARWMFERTLNEALSKLFTSPAGPIHINVPVREPFYPPQNENWNFEYQLKKIELIETQASLTKEQWDKVITLLLSSDKICLLSGHLLPNKILCKVEETFTDLSKIPLIADINSNLHTASTLVGYADILLSSVSEDTKVLLAPDIVISFGNEFVSKSTKQYFRIHKPKVHIHISENDVWVDTFQSVTHFLKISPTYFFTELINKIRIKANKDFAQRWSYFNKQVQSSIFEYIENQEFSELKSAAMALDSLPPNSVLHLANSLPVRYATIFGVDPSVDVFCNRGTSGIDGSVSAALGNALQTDRQVTLLTGDVGFLYDKNGLWHQFLPSNLKIIVINNEGGAIFRTVEGAKDQPELEEYFVGNQTFDIKSVAISMGLEYLYASDLMSLNIQLHNLYKTDKRATLLEIKTDGKQAAQKLFELKSKAKKDLENKI